MEKIKYIISACLAGLPCKYNGGSNPCPELVKLFQAGLVLPLCPETLAGLTSPRLPSEISLDGRVMSKDGQDLSQKFNEGAVKALQMALKTGCKLAIVKSRSPSCGYKKIYDGSFTGNLREGNGKWTELLLANGYEIWTEEKLPIELID